MDNEQIMGPAFGEVTSIRYMKKSGESVLLELPLRGIRITHTAGGAVASVQWESFIPSCDIDKFDKMTDEELCLYGEENGSSGIKSIFYSGNRVQVEILR